MHWIARNILKQLAFADEIRYAELKPDNVEGNLFQYYSRGLEKDGLIRRGSEGYSLTNAGRLFVADLSQSKLMTRCHQPRVMVAVVARNEAGQWLFFRWRRHPYRDLVSLPMGRQTAGRPASQVAAEQLLHKAGYSGDLRFLGIAQVVMDEQTNRGIVGESDHFIVQVFEATKLVGEYGSDGLTGLSFWGDPANLLPEQFVGGFREIIDWIDDPMRTALIEIRSKNESSD